MLKFYNYKSAMLYLFIRCMGEGFYKVMSQYGNIGDSRLKQKISKMKNYDKSAYHEVLYILEKCIKAFTEANFFDDEEEELKTDTVYCQKKASDKYYYTFGTLFDKFKWACKQEEPFFYEDFYSVMAYLIGKEFFIADKSRYKSSSDSTEIKDNLEYIKSLRTLDSKEYEELKKDILRKFRPEYKTALVDVRLNAKTTFYKWPIDEFFKQIGDKNKAEEILKVVFGKNKDDDSISKTFEKIRYERRKREWNTFKHLFQNELNDEDLMKLLNDEVTLKAYQIFQSRMSAAFFLENLLAELPNFIDDEKSVEIQKILLCDETCKKPDDFLIPNHAEKTENYKNQVSELLFANDSIERISEKLNELDAEAQATETIKAYVNLLNPSLQFYLTNQELYVKDLNNYLEICKHNPYYLEYFANFQMSIQMSISDEKYSMSSDLDNYLWR